MPLVGCGLLTPFGVPLYEPFVKGFGRCISVAFLSDADDAAESVLVMVSWRFLIPPFVIPNPCGVAALGFARWTPSALRSDTSEATRGLAAPRGEGTFGLLSVVDGLRPDLC